MSTRKIIIINNKAYRLRVEDSTRVERADNSDELNKILLYIQNDYKPLMVVDEIFSIKK